MVTSVVLGIEDSVKKNYVLCVVSKDNTIKYIYDGVDNLESLIDSGELQVNKVYVDCSNDTDIVDTCFRFKGIGNIQLDLRGNLLDIKGMSDGSVISYKVDAIKYISIVEVGEVDK